MKAVLSLVWSCCLAWFPSLFICAPLNSQVEPALLELFPEVPDKDGWTWAQEPTEYGPEDLFLYLDGGAPQYLSYGFVKLVHGRYAYRGNDLMSVTLDVFDMGSRLGAYGIYSSGRPREIVKRNWGTEGYRSGTVAAAWKGRVYLHGVADDETPILVAQLETLMDRAAAAIPGKVAQPAELSLLPVSRRISGSERYIGNNLLGHSFLPGGFLASYDINGTEGLLFVSDLKSIEAAREAFDLILAFENERGEIIKQGETGDASFWAQDPGLGLGAVILRGTHVGGLWYGKESPAAEKILKELDGNLASRFPRE